MSQSGFIPAEDAAFEQWLENFAAVCDANNTTLGLSPTEVTTIEGYSTTFNGAMNNVAQTKASFQGAVSGKNANRRTITTAVRALAREFKANPAISAELLRQLGIVSDNSAGPVRTVTGLTATGCSNGVNELKWNRNGNSPVTSFVIEYALGLSNDWNFAGVTTKTTFDHENQTPGVFLRYRVISNRAGQTSAPSDPVSIYTNGNDGALSLAA